MKAEDKLEENRSSGKPLNCLIVTCVICVEIILI